MSISWGFMSHSTNNKGHIATGPQHCHLQGSNPHRVISTKQGDSTVERFWEMFQFIYKSVEGGIIGEHVIVVNTAISALLLTDNWY